MIFNCVSISLYKKKQIYSSFFALFILLFLTLDQYFILYLFFYPLYFLTFYFFINTEIGLKISEPFIWML